MPSVCQIRSRKTKPDHRFRRGFLSTVHAKPPHLRLGLDLQIDRVFAVNARFQKKSKCESFGNLRTLPLRQSSHRLTHTYCGTYAAMSTFRRSAEGSQIRPDGRITLILTEGNARRARSALPCRTSLPSRRIALCAGSDRTSQRPFPWTFQSPRRGSFTPTAVPIPVSVARSAAPWPRPPGRWRSDRPPSGVQLTAAIRS
jgi:hypothetical protein